MSFLNNTLSVFRRISIVMAIAVAFLFGVATTVYLSLRSPEVTVPDVLGKGRFEAENILGGAGLNFRVRATRPSSQVNPDTVLFQLPRAGEIVKAGQTVAMDISRTTKEGESSEVVTAPSKTEDEKKSDASNVNANENRPKRTKITNKNGNDNGNTNSNRNSNLDRTRTTENSNTNTSRSTSDAAGANVNGSNESKNINSKAGENANKRPVPKPPLPNDNRNDR